MGWQETQRNGIEWARKPQENNATAARCGWTLEKKVMGFNTMAWMDRIVEVIVDAWMAKKVGDPTQRLRNAQMGWKVGKKNNGTNR